MPIQYDFRENPDLKGTGEPQPLHPRVVVAGTKTIDDIVYEISKYSSFRPGDVRGVLEELSQYCIRHLSEGYNVKLGEMGTFSVSLAGRQVMDKKEIRSVSISISDVNFRPTPDLIKYIRSAANIERVAPEYGFNTSSDKYTKEERLKMLTEYLEENTFITRKQYSALTGVLRAKATRELSEWAENKVIEKKGRQPHIIYCLA